MGMGSESSAGNLLPHWMRWFIPSIGDLIFVAFLGLLTFTALSVRLLGDAGIGWHIRTGQLILATHSIPRVDPFSSSMIGHPWYAWEWLYDVLVGALDTTAGLNGVVWFTAIVVAAVFGWTFRLLLLRGTNILLAVILLLLAASASMIHMLARPHTVTWLFTLAWYWILESTEARCDDVAFDSSRRSTTRKRVLFLPLLMLVWVNVHGGFLIGFVLLAIYWFSAAWRWVRLSLSVNEESFEDALSTIHLRRRLRNLTWAGILSAAATFINPYGFRLHVHIYRYLTNRFLMDRIDEFQSPNFHLVAQKCFAGLLLLAVIALAVKGRQAKLREILLLLFAVYSALYASRNIPVSSLLLILITGPWLSDAIDRLTEKFRRRTPASLGTAPFLTRMKEIDLCMRGHFWATGAVLLTAWIVAHGGNLGSSRLMNAHFSAKKFPVDAVAYFEEQSLPGPVLSPDFWGGYLIYRLYPREKVVIDDRHDFYGEQFLQSYLKMIHLEPGWSDFLQQHPAGSIIVPKNSAFANILLETSSCRMIYNDDVAAIFVPTDESRK